MIGAGHVIAFFIGAFVGRYLEEIIEIIKKIRNDVEDIQRGRR